MSKANVSSSGSRILRVLKALRGHALNGVSNGELASALGESPANINRALNTLIEEGLALKLENGRFAPGVQLLQIAMAHNNEMSRAQGRIDELNQRVSAPFSIRLTTPALPVRWKRPVTLLSASLKAVCAFFG